MEKKSISSHLFPFLSAIPQLQPYPTRLAQRSRTVSALGHQGREVEPQVFSLACAWPKETPYDLSKDTHTPLPYGLTQDAERYQGFNSPQACTRLCISSELILNREKRERKLTVLEAVEKVLIPPNHRNKIVQYLLHVMPGSRLCYNPCT